MSEDVLILDGGLATQLEARGHDLNHDLWSARLLIENPREILAVHQEYLTAGADCIATASYQATTKGFEHLGVDSQKADELIRSTVRLAQDARIGFWSQESNRLSRCRPLVAASVGPYGAFLANGSEYSGDYKLTSEDLHRFHEHRWNLLADEGPDVMLCETIPSLLEAEALARLANDKSSPPTWISFSCRDGKHISDGTSISQVAGFLDGQNNIEVIGVNCTAPRFIDDLIREIRLSTEKPIAVYPNSGEAYDVENRNWSGEKDVIDFAKNAVQWRAAGASYIGGCCRTTPKHIRQIRDAFCS